MQAGGSLAAETKQRVPDRDLSQEKALRYMIDLTEVLIVIAGDVLFP